ncbi:hypothetical protein Q5424_16075 [Conexibacter sp. JD483]|uniref:hypothetical protein n=1 Tax=unclassified Conexibacter TaxID=2627773 RepID=UPI0027208409|nr:MULTISPECIES: hypothetical protein [unclassified Conexibacter]MDO8186643.1 hypothetical protein [Conexibacter sp. CPCC 205706]MDO8200363.1 hypothetical protein [Conexibacter sp. CPCC 205762]MDR9370615.1 hypothetical protein [Conexibacter sp. JD483]
MVALRELGHEVLDFPQVVGGRAIAFEQVASCDLVHIHRFVPNDDDTFVPRLKERGVVVTFDNDDAMDVIPPAARRLIEGVKSPDYIQAAVDMFHRTLALMPLFDLVTVPSEALGERMREAGALDVRVIDNRLPDRFLDVPTPEPDRLTIGWHGFVEHMADYEALGLREVFERLLDKQPHIQLFTIGLDLGLDDDRYGWTDWVHFEQLTKKLASFDLGLAPIVDNAFNRSRSNCKVREYAAAGVPWLASPVGPYQRLGKEEGGKLVADGDWYQEIEQALKSPFKRSRAARRAKAWAKRETISQTVALWEDAFYDALESAERTEQIV